MTKRIAPLAAVILTAALCACATTKSEVSKSEDVKSEDVRVYNPAELKQGGYETVARVWVETWRTAFWVPTYSTRGDSVGALRDKAAALGANGLTNVDCYGDSGMFGGALAYTCYGKAIKVREDSGRSENSGH